MNIKHALALFLTFLSCQVMAANYYVGATSSGDKSGRDVNNLIDLATVNQKLIAGDNAYLLDSRGKYNTKIEPVNSGESELKRISYLSYPGHNPTFDFGDILNGWEKYSGTDGVDAIYRKKYGVSVTDPIMVTIDTIEQKKEKSILWNVGNLNGASGKLNRYRDGCYSTSCMIPGDQVYIDGYTYVRTYENDNPSNHEIHAIPLRTLGIQLVSNNYISIKGLTFQYVKMFASIKSSDHVTLEDNKFLYGFGYGTIDIRDSDYIKFSNNLIKGAGSIPAHSAEALSFIGGNFALIENNDISYFGHNGISMVDTKDCIIRNNYIHHGFGKNILVKGWGSRRNVIDNNRSDDSPNAYQVRTKHWAEHAGIAIGGEHTIVRFNQFMNNSVAMDFTTIITDPTYTSPHHRVYHNVAYGSVPTRYHVHGGIMFYLDQQRDVKIMNNILSENMTGTDKTDGVAITESVPSQLGFANPDFISIIKPTISNNLLWSSIRTDKLLNKNTINYFESVYPNLAKSNIGNDPLLTLSKTPSQNFRLKSGSPAIDAGAFLTTTNGSYSGKTVKVMDARFFIDGFGIVTGDKIKIGTHPVVTITEVNYDTNTITHNGNISGAGNEGVSFNYSGGAPDIGAYEYNLGESTTVVSTPPSPPTNLSIQIVQ